MTDDELIDLARKGYATGRITPTRGDSCQCFLGAVSLALTGEIHDVDFTLESVVKIQPQRIFGILDGFDGHKRTPPFTMPLGDYDDGYTLGKQAAKMFLSEMEREGAE